MSQPTSIGDLLKQYFIIRPDGSVDHDMVVALARAAEMHQDPLLSLNKPMAIFYQHPYELDQEARIQKLYRKMWFTGTGILEFIYKKLRLGKGTYPLDSILATAGNNKARRRQLERVLNDFDLFVIENGMISLRPGLSTTDFIHRDTISRKARRAAELTQQDYSDNLFPEESREADLAEAQRLNEEVREHNESQLIQFL